MRQIAHAQRQPEASLESRSSFAGRRRRRRLRSSRGMRSMRSQSVEEFLRNNSAALSSIGVTLAVFVSRKFLILPVAIAVMMIQEKLAAAGLDRAERIVRGQMD
jgi:hypothetical protein